ncbi:NUDIX domain-containing protein [Paenibacillus alvei]|uniref:NUDIX domain-containing protein n=1 Tax=Paenibacillus alvei TaxID=44250 RepID=UPI0002899659|nr:NUDIX domain-containing protein [Paenibacillus alvei]EJW13915.1 hypothetical protein PAV_141p00210 [Paenibacillus alvei DSM 29]MCY9544707.1 NUDIX domain-containing protein [Paenibacillus alvei]MCY9707721.1 NUDIX domain-containing protein [Paenibacillus alvei]MCY9757702.1 NUDIX domain-containing protein [Paenibacillus alvei]MEC0082766.1 NUDIX domain-containing protein [Paenibacillus alvei]
MTVKHESLYKTKWVELMQRTSDEDGTYIYIREPWLINGKAISVLPLRRDESGYIQFLLRGEMAEKPVFGTVKGGMDKESETPRQCAVRELLEEAGYIADETQMIPLGKVRTSKLNTTEMYLFAVDVTDLPYEEPKGDGTANEANAYCQWVSERDAIGYEDPVIHTSMLRFYNWVNEEGEM